MTCSKPFVGAALLRRLTAMCLLGLSCVSLACQDRQCEASRLALTQSWETLRNTAASRKQIPEATDLTKPQEDARIRIWTDIEAEAELMRSSFETTQVTWSSADKARGKLSELFRPLAANEDPMTRGFAATLADADQRMEAFRKQCR